MNMTTDILMQVKTEWICEYNILGKPTLGAT